MDVAAAPAGPWQGCSCKWSDPDIWFQRISGQAAHGSVKDGRPTESDGKPVPQRFPWSRMENGLSADSLPQASRVGRILVLGAAGQLGRAAAAAFRVAGWQVASLVRGHASAAIAPGTELVEVDARDTGAVIAAARGADVVLHALNVPYTQWSMEALPLAETAVAAAGENGATLVFPGNLYIYGAGIPAIVDETAAVRPTSRKGEIRAAIEARMRDAADASSSCVAATFSAVPASVRISTAYWSAKLQPGVSPIPGHSTWCTNGPMCPMSAMRCCVSSKRAPGSSRLPNSDFPAMR
jgi:NAD(P)H-binding